MRKSGNASSDEVRSNEREMRFRDVGGPPKGSRVPNAASPTRGARSFGALYGSAKGPRNVRISLDLINDIVPLRGARLLDIGCGNGVYTQAMAEQFIEVDAIDVEDQRLTLFREQNKRKNIRIHKMSGDKLAFPSNAFDAVTAIEVVEHVADLRSVLDEVHRVLRPGGIFALTTPNRLWPLEQHGFVLGGKRLPGWLAPGLVWVPPLHAALSDADAFTLFRLQKVLTRAMIPPIGHRYMFPPLDRFEDGHLLHKIFDLLSKTPLRRAAQTIVVVGRKSPN